MKKTAWKVTRTSWNSPVFIFSLTAILSVIVVIIFFRYFQTRCFSPTLFPSTPTLVPKPTLRPLRLTYWNEEAKEYWLTFISRDKKIAFHYPESMVVVQQQEGKIYVLPRERFMQADLNLNSGFAIILSDRADFEVSFEDNAQIIGYDRIAFRYEDDYDDIPGVTFYHKLWKSYLVKAERDDKPYGFIYVTYTTNEEKSIASSVIGSIVTSEDYDLSSVSLSEAKIPFVVPVNSKLYTSSDLAISLYLVDGFVAGESYAKEGNAHVLQISKDNCSLSISDNPENVSFSTSGALCGNKVSWECNNSGKYLIPYLGDHLTLVRDDHPDGKYIYRGLFYDYSTHNLSGVVVSSGPLNPSCLSGLLKILYSLHK